MIPLFIFSYTQSHTYTPKACMYEQKEKESKRADDFMRVPDDRFILPFACSHFPFLSNKIQKRKTTYKAFICELSLTQNRTEQNQLHPIEQSVKRHNSSEIETQPTLILFFTLSWFFSLSFSSLSFSLLLTFLCRPWPMNSLNGLKIRFITPLEFSKLNFLLVTHLNCTSGHTVCSSTDR